MSKKDRELDTLISVWLLPSSSAAPLGADAGYTHLGVPLRKELHVLSRGHGGERRAPER